MNAFNDYQISSQLTVNESDFYFEERNCDPTWVESKDDILKRALCHFVILFSGLVGTRP